MVTIGFLWSAYINVRKLWQRKKRTTAKDKHSAVISQFQGGEGEPVSPRSATMVHNPLFERQRTGTSSHADPSDVELTTFSDAAARSSGSGAQLQGPATPSERLSKLKALVGSESDLRIGAVDDVDTENVAVNPLRQSEAAVGPRTTH